jgi:hypothetical protein
LKATACLLGAALCCLIGAVGSASGAPRVPAWSIQATSQPTVFKPGDESGHDSYELFVSNSGAKASDGSPLVIEDALPSGLGVKGLVLGLKESRDEEEPSACKTALDGSQSVVTCEIEGADAVLVPDEQLRLRIALKVPPNVVGELVNQARVEGGGAPEARSIESHNTAGEGEAESGFQNFQATLTGADGKSVTGADSHPYEYTTTFAVNVNDALPGSPGPFVPAEGDVKNLESMLPPGLSGGGAVTESRCTSQQFNTTFGVRSPKGGTGTANECPDSAAVGVVAVRQLEGNGKTPLLPLFNLVPPKGMPLRFGFQFLGLPFFINTKLRSESDYGVTSYLENTTEARRFTAFQITIWGVPADPSHDAQRGNCTAYEVPCPAEIEAKPFLRLPSSCESPLTTTFSFDTWLHPGSFVSSPFTEAAPTECELPDFSPTIESKPTTNVADAPSGLHFDLHLPQAANEDPEGLGEADLRDVKVVLPEGFLINPSSADGLAVCSPEQIGLKTPVGRPDASYTNEAPNCPDSSKIGSVAVDTSLVDHPLPGAVYLASPHQNPFDSLLAIYIVVADPQTGVIVKLAGQVEADPNTGRLTTTVTNNPQTPFEDFKLDFFEGARAPLRTPAVCATYRTTTSIKPWTAPASGPDATPTDSFEVSKPPAGEASCPTSPSAQPNNPSFEAGTASPVAGSYQPFTLHLARQDGSQEIKGLNLDLPPGLTGKLAGLTYCPEASLSAAVAKSGRAEQSSPSCPASSRLGSVAVAAGAGPAPYRAQGSAYLAGPYKGAPISVAIITPAVAGPFDLGTVVTRTALYVDPQSARIHAVSDPIPTILEGIPLDVRSIDLNLDRRSFALNPTSCDPTAFSGQALSLLGQSASISQRFQVGGCGSLGFKPKLSLKLKGKTKRGGFPALRAIYVPKPGDANLKDMSLRFPRSEFIEQAHFRTICTRVQYAANACPPGSVYGHISATTPLLDQPLEGPVYLRSSSHQLPDVVFALRGQIDAEVAVHVDSVGGGLRATVEESPDVPISRVVLDMQGGKKGLFVNSRDICKTTYKATGRLSAQSGKEAEIRPPLKAKCGQKAKKRRR